VTNYIHFSSPLFFPRLKTKQKPIPFSQMRLWFMAIEMADLCVNIAKHEDKTLLLEKMLEGGVIDSCYLIKLLVLFIPVQSLSTNC
jgi:hypothetical protein